MNVASVYGTRGTETGVTIRPLGLERGTRRGLVVSHGRAAKGADILTGSTVSGNGAGVVLGQQFPTISTDMSGTTHWGNPASVTKFGDAVTAIRADWASGDPIVMYLLSMGALTGLLWALANPTQVVAIAIGLGCVDLVYEHDQNVGGFASEIETAHGVSGTYAGNATITARDPMQNTAALAAFPMKFWYASDDTVAITARQQAFIAATGCESVNLGAVGHTLGSVPGSDVTNFLRDHA